MMAWNKFHRRAVALCREYDEFSKEGVIGISGNSVHLNSGDFFRWFSRECCEKKYHAPEYPTRYSKVIDGIEYLCLTTEPWVGGDQI